MPLSAGRITPRSMDDRQWSAYIANAGIQADSSIKSFAPGWLGFSSDPVGEINYYDFGAIVILWRDTALTGTSDEAFMVLSGLPEEIRPTSGRTVKCVLEIGTDVIDGTATINELGGIAFGAGDTTTVVGRVTYSANFTPAGSKGLPAGWMIQYSK